MQPRPDGRGRGNGAIEEVLSNPNLGTSERRAATLASDQTGHACGTQETPDAVSADPDAVLEEQSAWMRRDL